MRAELKKALKAKGYSIDGTDVTDDSVKDFSSRRNVAQVRINPNGTITVNVYRGRWYKISEAEIVDSVEKAIALIEARPKGQK